MKTTMLQISIFLLSCSNHSSDRRGNIYKLSSIIEDSLKNNNSDIMVQSCATDYSFVPDYYRIQKSKELFDLDSPKSEIDSAYKKTNAVDYIIEQASKSEVVILNEAHHYPRHRSFATDLLNGLKQNGYKYLGIETLNNQPSFNVPNYPTKDLGYYSVEPTFSNFIREAIRLDFILFPYESIGKNGKEREIEQAENISKFLSENKEGKTFIYCGYDHNIEGELFGWEKAMAGRLNEYTGINPLTINQTVFNDIETSNNSSYVLIDSLNNSYKYSEGNDIFVFHPTNKTEFKRFEWKKRDDNNWLKVDFLPMDTKFPVLIKVYYDSEEKENNGIPYDIIEMTSHKMENWLIVPESNYVVVVEDSEKKEKIIALD